MRTCTRATVDVQSIAGLTATLNAVVVAGNTDLIASTVVMLTAADANYTGTSQRNSTIHGTINSGRLNAAASDADIIQPIQSNTAKATDVYCTVYMHDFTASKR